MPITNDPEYGYYTLVKYVGFEGNLMMIEQIYRENGYAVLKNILTYLETHKISEDLHKNIEKCANQVNCSKEHYLKNVSRWIHPSVITNLAYSWVKDNLQEKVSRHIGRSVNLIKMNIISKSPYAKDPVPCHQDIAYSHEHPYEFSLWIALQKVTLQDGALEFLPGSHLTEIKSAVDFWQPDFRDTMYLSQKWQTESVSLPIEEGDAIMFDSRIWHRSAENTSGTYRFAIACRFSSDYYQPPSFIPTKIPALFGMWTCGQITLDLLKQGLVAYLAWDIELIQHCTLLYLLDAWLNLFQQEIKLPFQLDYHQAKQALYDVSILHQSAEMHNGGDAQGTVYRSLWHHFLYPMQEWLKSTGSSKGIMI